MKAENVPWISYFYLVAGVVFSAEVRENLQELVFSFHYVDLEVKLRSSGLVANLCPLSHLTDPEHGFI